MPASNFNSKEDEMSLDFKDTRADTPDRLRVPAPTEYEVRVSDLVDFDKLDPFKDRQSFELALVAYFEQLQDPRLTSLGGIPVDTSERRWMVAMSLSGLLDEVKNLGKNRQDEQKRLEQEAKDGESDEDAEEVEIQTTNPRSRIDALLREARLSDNDDSARRNNTAMDVDGRSDDPRQSVPQKGSADEVRKGSDRPTHPSDNKK